MPVTMPVPASTVALAGLLLDHAPPVVSIVKGVLSPVHTNALPEIVVALALKFAPIEISRTQRYISFFIKNLYRRKE
jgi:hypothetical protein